MFTQKFLIMPCEKELLQNLALGGKCLQTANTANKFEAADNGDAEG